MSRFSKSNKAVRDRYLDDLKHSLRHGVVQHRKELKAAKIELQAKSEKVDRTWLNKHIATETGTDWDQFGGFHYEDPAIAKLSSGVYPFADPAHSMTNSSSTWQVVGAR